MKLRKIIFGTLVIALFSSCGSPKTANEVAETENVIKSKVESGAMIVDVRTPKEFQEGTYQGAVNIPLNEIANRIDEFKEKKDIVVFCRSGNRSQKAMNILAEHGITNVTNGISQKNMEESMK